MSFFTVPGAPQGKARARTVLRGNRVHSFTPEKTVLYENIIKLSYKGEMYTEPVTMSIIAFYPIPKSMPKYKREMALNGSLRPTVKPDIDNVIKAVCDALNGIAYKDDTLVVDVTASKFYSKTPQLVVTINKR